MNSRVAGTAYLHCILLLAFVISGWQPLDRQTWLIENILVLVGAVAVWLVRHEFYWSCRSWIGVTAFVCLHQVGTHFTYPQVPYNEAIAFVTGIELDTVFGWQRNQYDRFVHLAYGLLLTLPLREIVTEKCHLKGAWASLIAWSLVLSTSMLYELMEWAGAAHAGGGDSAFVGAQGDFWDAQKDMAVAAVGSLVVLMCRGHEIRNKVSALRGRLTSN
jgi:putative membrane protein